MYLRFQNPDLSYSWITPWWVEVPGSGYNVLRDLEPQFDGLGFPGSGYDGLGRKTDPIPPSIHSM